MSGEAQSAQPTEGALSPIQKQLSTRAVARGIAKLSLMKRDEKNSVAVAAAAAARRGALPKEKNFNTMIEERKKAMVPSADLPKKRCLPHREPTVEARGSDTTRTSMDATAIDLPKRSMTRRQETI